MGAWLAPTGSRWREAWPQSLPAGAPLGVAPEGLAPGCAGLLGGLVRLSSAPTAITTSIASSTSSIGFTICSGICSIGIESSPAGLHPPWARIWFLDGAAQPVRPCRLLHVTDQPSRC